MTTPQQTRQAMIVAAAQEIHDRGYTAASLSSIAGRLGLTKGALSHHFPTKNDLASALIVSLHDAIRKADVEARNAYPSSGARATIAFLLNIGMQANDDPIVTAGIDLFTDRSSPGYQLVEVIEEWCDVLADYLRLARVAGELDDGVPIEEAADHLVITTIGSSFFGAQTYRRRPGQKRVRFMRFALKAVGIQSADQVVDEVLETQANGTVKQLPPSAGIPLP